ncbi:hypothetical protein [Streptomyces vinaceus]|uniref:hypothetical protein n=1 Tax=Streptomyces vinaceus TaxID=1960 RepID=UPI0036B81F0D
MAPSDPAPYSDADLQRLADAAVQRRRELGLALNAENAKKAGLSRGPWQRVERGEVLRLGNYVKMDALLRWAPGTCVGILKGGVPVPAEPSAVEPGTVISELPPEVHEAEARDVIKLAAIATTDGLTSEQIRALSERAVQDLRAAGLL